VGGVVNLSRYLSRRPLLSVSELSRRTSRTRPAPSVGLSRNLSRPCPVGNQAGTGQTLRLFRAEWSRPAAQVKLILGVTLLQVILSTLGVIVGWIAGGGNG